MNQTTNTIKYFAYVRKSTEGEERQALSIESQRDKVKEFFSGLEIVDYFEERHSAFKPYNRPQFDEMIKRIRKGEAQGIIAWHPDRLSRNEIDASTLTYMIRTGVIDDLKFVSYNFDNSPEGIMMLQLALSQSQYFSSKLGKDVKRGLEKKVSLGWLPGVAPEGYLNDVRLEKGQRTLITDKKRAPLLRKAFEMMLTGSYTAQAVYNEMIKWGYTTRQKPKMGGQMISRSAWYKILANPFYAGIIVYNGKESPGKHKPIISLDEFNRIQELVGLRGCVKRPKKHEFTYAGLMNCGVCGCAITAERKTKYIKSNNTVRGYLYYHCTHKKKQSNCHEGSVLEEDLEKQVKIELKKLEIHPLFLDWALEYLDKEKNDNSRVDKIISENQNDKIIDLENEKSELISMRSKKLINDESFSKQLTNLETEINNLKGIKTSKPKSANEIIELTKEKFIFCAHALKEFDDGSENNKKELLTGLGSNRTIISKNLSISYHEWYIPLINKVSEFNAELARLEPPIFGEYQRKNEALTSLNLRWLPGSDSNQESSDL